MTEVAIIGFGSRGQNFARLLREEQNARLTAIAEPVETLRRQAEEQFGVSKERCFSDADEFFACGKMCDAVFICTQDAQHCEMALRALELGYDICLEKPAAVTIEECEKIRDTANRLGRKVMLTHVLRYAPFYGYIKKLISDGTLGDIVDMDLTENVAYWHFALSYVRGPWRDMKKSTPTIIAKCCHDLDLIQWLMNKKCTQVSSYGQLYYFRPDHAPAGSAEYCTDCAAETREACPYNAYRVYPERVTQGVVGGTARLKGRDIFEVIDNKEDIISRCVFHCDNDAVDNQVVNLCFADGSTAHLTMTAFSEDCHRTICVHGTEGEVFGDCEEAKLYVNHFGKSRTVVDINELEREKNKSIDLSGGHGGGDYYLLKDFLDYITVCSPSMTRTTIDDSVESHIIGFKAEESRLNGGKSIDLQK